MIAIESFLTILFYLSLPVLLLAFWIRFHWSAIRRYFIRWYQNDHRKEEEKRREEENRKKAEEEVQTWAPSSDDIQTQYEIQTNTHKEG